MISKELLSEVVGHSITILEENTSLNPRGVDVVFRYNNHRGTVGSINIYELAHKCKEWVWKNHSLIIHSGRSIFDKNLYISRIMDIDGKNIKLHGFQADAEPEAIFKACKWILNQGKQDGKM